jgi:hypothetical protein
MGLRMGVKAAVVALVVLLLLPGVSQAITVDQRTLEGLKGVQVLVEDMKPEAERLGLTKAQIQTDVESRLRQGGVKVLTDQERLKTPGTPYLYVNVNTSIRPGSTVCAHSTSVSLNELVALARGFQAFGIIWSSGSVGSVETQKIGLLREVVGGHIDKFINDYQAANPMR